MYIIVLFITVVMSMLHVWTYLSTWSVNASMQHMISLLLKEFKKVRIVQNSSSTRKLKILNINNISWNYTKSLSEPQELQFSTSRKDLCNIWRKNTIFLPIPRTCGNSPNHGWYLWRHKRDLASKSRRCPTHIAQVQRCIYISEIIVLLMFNRNICHINANWL